MSNFRTGAWRLLVLTALIATLTSGCSKDRSFTTQDVLRRHAIDPAIATYLQKARATFDAGEYQRALAYADSANAVAEGPDAWFLKGLIFTELAQFESAKKAFQQTIELDPLFRQARFQIGQAEFQQGQYSRAIAAYRDERQMIENSPADVKAYYREVDPQALPRIWQQMGRAYERLSQSDSALAAYTQSLKLDSTNAQAHAWLSELLETRGDLPGALHEAEKAMTLEQSVEYVYRASAMLVKNGRAREAIAPLRQVLALQPTHEGANYNLGRAYMMTGKQKEARPYLERAKVLQKLQADLAMKEAAAYQQPKNPGRWVELADLLWASGRAEDARQALSVAVYLKPSDLRVQNDLGNMSLAMGDTTAALIQYKRLLRQDSTFADGWFNLGVVEAYRGRMTVARAHWARALRLDPANARARAYLAGKTDPAPRQLNQVAAQ